MMQAPRRFAHLEPDDETSSVKTADSEESLEKDAEIKTASGSKSNPWETWEDDTAIFNAKVAAMVNGAPILNGDVLDRYSLVLIEQKKQMEAVWTNREKLPAGQPRPTPDDFQQVREYLVRRDLPSHIQRKLLVERMKSSLKPDQIKMMNAHIDELFNSEVDKLKQQMKVSTRTELELELNKKGTTLQNVKDNFATERLAMEYIIMKSDKPAPIERSDMMAYYNEHIKDYEVPEKIRWEQIQVTFGPERSMSEAKKKIEEARKELDSGVPFAEVAKKYSDGPTARSGGARDWMERGNLADAKLEKILFSLKAGQRSSIYESASDFQIIGANEKKPAGRIPLGEVQDEIKQKLIQEQNKTRSTKFLKDLFSEAIIESPYDLPPL